MTCHLLPFQNGQGHRVQVFHGCHISASPEEELEYLDLD